jgi:hypothetical protein
MEDVLRRLAFCSHVPAASYQPRGRSGATDSVDLTGRDVGEHTIFQIMYGPPFHPATPRNPGARDDEERGRIIRAAEAQLAHLRGRTALERPLGETQAELDQRILTDPTYIGWSPEVVATDAGVTPARVRRLRARDQRDQETGRPLPDYQAPLPAKERKRRVREATAAASRSPRSAARMNISLSTVERDLGKRAA